MGTLALDVLVKSALPVPTTSVIPFELTPTTETLQTAADSPVTVQEVPVSPFFETTDREEPVGGVKTTL
jgi:hypothetical protein